MKPTVLKITLAVSLLAAMPAYSAKPVSEAPKWDFFDAIISAMAELERVDSKKAGGTSAWLERVASYRHSPETSTKLVKVFGSERPYVISREPARNGSAWRAQLPAGRHAGENYNTTEWADLSATLALDKQERNLVWRASWPSFSMEDKTARMELAGMRAQGQQRRGFGGMWFGTSQADIERIAFTSAESGVGVELERLGAIGTVIERAKTVEISYGLRVAAVKFLGEQIDDFRMAVRVVNVDKKTLATFKAQGEKKSVDALTDEQRDRARQAMVATLGSAMLARGAAVEIDDVSASFKGHTAQVKGRVWFDGAGSRGLNDAGEAMKKLAARIDLKVPLGLVKEVMQRVAKNEISKRNGDTGEQAVAQAGQIATDILVGKLVGAGMAKVEDDHLVATLTYRDGEALVNGKSAKGLFPSTAPQKPETVPAAPQPLLQARLISGSCQMPDYPEEVVREDQPLQLVLRFTVGADGSVRNGVVEKASGWPAYDEAVLATLARCRYIPALRGSKQVDYPTTLKLVREPGSTRP